MTRPWPQAGRLLALCILILCGTSCALREVPVPEKAAHTTATWQQGPFAVVFRAGPQVLRESRSFSSYVVSRSLPTLSGPAQAVVESALHINHFLWNPQRHPEEWIRFMSSDSGNTLLIIEEVPNDCAPCWNWIVVTTGDIELELDHAYLTLPARPARPSEIFRETPEVTAISDTTITCRYADGETRTVPWKEWMKKERRPIFPG